MSDEKKISSPLLTSVRFLLTVLLFLAVTIQYTHKSEISVAILCMVNHTVENENNSLEYSNLKSSTNCRFYNSSSRDNINGGFIWNKKDQGIILSSYFVGYFISQIPGGLLAFKFGSTRVIFFGMLTGSICTILVPFCAKYYYILVLSRFLTGLAQGTIWPSIMNHWNVWSKSEERGRLISFTDCGSQIGKIIAFSLGGYLCVNGFDGGWPSIFYSFGSAGIIWCLVWSMVSTDSPRTHKFIKNSEREFIMNEITEDYNKKILIGLWKSIFTSKSCLVLICHHISSSWASTLYLTNVPIYMKEILKFDIESNGLWSSIPFVGLTFVNIISGIISDKLIEMNKFSKNSIRKFFSVWALIIPGTSIIGLSYVQCSEPYLGVAILTFVISMGGLSNGGYATSYNDIAGQYASLVFGIANSFGQSTGIFIPYIASALTENHTPDEWRHLFVLSSVIMLVGALITSLFGSTNTEPWALKSKQESSLNRDSSIINN